MSLSLSLRLFLLQLVVLLLLSSVSGQYLVVNRDYSGNYVDCNNNFGSHSGTHLLFPAFVASGHDGTKTHVCFGQVEGAAFPSSAVASPPSNFSSLTLHPNRLGGITNCTQESNAAICSGHAGTYAIQLLLSCNEYPAAANGTTDFALVDGVYEIVGNKQTCLHLELAIEGHDTIILDPGTSQTANIFVPSGSSVTVTASVIVSASGHGGLSGGSSANSPFHTLAVPSTGASFSTPAPCLQASSSGGSSPSGGKGSSPCSGSKNVTLTAP